MSKLRDIFFQNTGKIHWNRDLDDYLLIKKNRTRKTFLEKELEKFNYLPIFRNFSRGSGTSIWAPKF